jgi:L-threonylcarbamoyladenylate synthase
MGIGSMRTLYLRVAVTSANTKAAFVGNPGAGLQGPQPAIEEAAAIIRCGGLVAFPTETVYGLGANALDREAVLRIFAAKQRPAWDPIIVHACSIAMAQTLVTVWPPAALKLAERFMPGPLTLLLPKRAIVPDACTAGREKVGIRIPAHPVALALIEAAAVPIAAPSANRFGGPSPTTVSHVERDLGGRIDAILDAGPAEVGVESTVLDPTTDPPIIYRPGGVSREQIEAIVGPVRLAERELRDDAPPESLESPGLGIRHYAPHAALTLVADESTMQQAVARHLARGERVGLMLPQDWLGSTLASAGSSAATAGQCVVFSWGPFDAPETLAQRLYQGLRWLDECQATVIVCPLPSKAGLGLAIHDRLRKAARR